ncbi:MAG TPA: hypothetical protein VGR06_25950 [Actinophytocola sp.]|nr:hypothetical protein [Actinophytocola sp.]
MWTLRITLPAPAYSLRGSVTGGMSGNGFSTFAGAADSLGGAETIG